MARFSANLSIMWPDLDVYDRFEAAANAGFRFVEIGVIDKLDHERIRDLLSDLSQTLVLFNPFPGDWHRHELGFVGVPGREDDFDRALTAALSLAGKLETRMLNTLVGVVKENRRHIAEETAIRNLSKAASAAAEVSVTLLIEAVNTVDVPDYLAATTADAARLVTAVDRPNVRMLFDVYHSAIAGENVEDSLKTYLPLIGHIHIADYPGRHEPGTGSLPIAEFIASLDRAGYDGFIGLEYSPAADTATGLGWLESFPSRTDRDSGLVGGA
jgi:hydroxypyruvate isomerase